MPMRASSSIVTDSGWRQCTILPRNTLLILEVLILINRGVARLERDSISVYPVHIHHNNNNYCSLDTPLLLEGSGGGHKFT